MYFSGVYFVSGVINPILIAQGRPLPHWEGQDHITPGFVRREPPFVLPIALERLHARANDPRGRALGCRAGFTVPGAAVDNMARSSPSPAFTQPTTYYSPTGLLLAILY